MSQTQTEANDTIEFETEETGAKVTITAKKGTLLVTLNSDAVDVRETTATIDREQRTDVLNLGIHRVQGERERLFVPIEGRKEEIEQLREDSELEPNDEPVEYVVTERTRTGGWGQEITNQSLSLESEFGHMTERQAAIHRQKVDEENDVPEDAEAGDTVLLQDIVDDMKTREEKRQEEIEEAIEEAQEKGEEVVIRKSHESCNDSRKQCDIDMVTLVATPEGDTEERRTHTH